MKQTPELTAMQKQLTQARREAEDARREVLKAEKLRDHKQQNVTELEAKIEEAKKRQNITVSDHAIVRYLERVKGLNVDDLKNEILNPELLRLTTALGGSGEFPTGTFKAVMKEHTIVTIKI